jgi:hypothetical protein
MTVSFTTAATRVPPLSLLLRNCSIDSNATSMAQQAHRPRINFVVLIIHSYRFESLTTRARLMPHRLLLRSSRKTHASKG